MTKSMSEVIANLKHGSQYAYGLGCRCDECRAGVAERAAKFRERNKGALAPDDPRHGKLSTYSNYGCRCGKCREVHNSRQRDYMARRREEFRKAMAEAAWDQVSVPESS